LSELEVFIDYQTAWLVDDDPVCELHFTWSYLMDGLSVPTVDQFAVTLNGSPAYVVQCGYEDVSEFRVDVEYPGSPVLSCTVSYSLTGNPERDLRNQAGLRQINFVGRSITI